MSEPLIYCACGLVIAEIKNYQKCKACLYLESMKEFKERTRQLVIEELKEDEVND